MSLVFVIIYSTIKSKCLFVLVIFQAYLEILLLNDGLFAHLDVEIYQTICPIILCHISNLTSFLADLAKGHVSYCHHLVSPLSSVIINSFFFKTQKKKMLLTLNNINIVRQARHNLQNQSQLSF